MTEVLKSVMDFCFNIAGNYGISIIIFTLITKIILLPLSIWVQKNSIKMVKMQPEINEIHAKYFGNKDQIAEEETALYKHEHYNAFASLIPLIVQIVLLLGVVNVIKSPSQAALDSGFSFLGINLGWITVENWGLSILAPVIAGLSALALCIAQNKMNVLQAEQTKFNKISMLLFSVGLSLYLGFFVQFGVALYWTASNIMAIIQQWLLNVFIDPKKSVDYERLEKSRKALQELKDLISASLVLPIRNLFSIPRAAASISTIRVLLSIFLSIPILRFITLRTIIMIRFSSLLKSILTLSHTI